MAGRRVRRAVGVMQLAIAAPSASTKTGSVTTWSAARAYRLNPKECPPLTHASWPKPLRAAQPRASAWKKTPTPHEPLLPQAPPQPPPLTPTHIRGNTREEIWTFYISVTWQRLLISENQAKGATLMDAVIGYFTQMMGVIAHCFQLDKKLYGHFFFFSS